jgi:hypothetical protein
VSGGIRPAWEHLSLELWNPLANYGINDVVAPRSLFSDLFVSADEYLSPRPTDAELEEVRNDPDKAQVRFLALKGTDFNSESAVVHFLEDVHELITDYEIPGFEDLYRRLLRAVVVKFNLRYRLDDPCILRFLLPGSFTNLYGELQRLNTSNVHLAGLLVDFERAFDQYARTQDPTDLKTSIHKVSNYAEGLASATRGAPGTLGALCDQLTDWPHDKVKEALKDIYKFCSDYPGIRHGGNPAGVRRNLATRDVTLACLLVVSFTGYLTPLMDESQVLGI